MNVLFLMLAYPDVRQCSTNLYTDLAAEFALHGHAVYVAAPLSAGNVNILQQEGEVQVLRIKTHKLFNVNPIKKGIANLLLPSQFKAAIKAQLGGIKFDIVITPTPPITFGKIAQWVKKTYKAKHYLILRDIFPQNAKDLGIIKNTLIFNFFRKKEKQLYHIADHIGCMSQANIDFVLTHNPWIDSSKLHLLPNWETPTPYIAPTGRMKEKYGLQGKFASIFGGNIGLPQQLEFMLELAERKKNTSNIVFLVIGNGTERKRIEALAKTKGLTNILFRNTISREDYNELVRECELGLICLNARFTIPNLPSKTLSYFNAKIPVLASIDRATDFGLMLDEAQAGLWSITGNIDEYEKNFDLLYHDAMLRKKMGENGFEYLQQQLTTAISYKKILEALNI